MKSIWDLALDKKRLFLRVDFNVPLESGRVSDDNRITAALPTVRHAVKHGAKVICASHLGKPKGKRDPKLSLAPVAAKFAELLKSPVRFVEDCVGPEVKKVVKSLGPGEVLLLENLRFHAGEEANDPDFANHLASLADVYVNDAFGSAHRSHASIVGVPGLLSEKGVGLLMEKEVQGLSRLHDPERPFAVILGGAKISGKIDALLALSRQADVLLIGGGIANYFLRALGLPIGRSLLEEERVPVARQVLDLCKREEKAIAVPSDFVVAKSPEDTAGARTVGISQLPSDAMILDVGQKTVEQFARLLARARTIFWNGPMGVFEKPPFDRGTRALAMLLAASNAITVVGGGESVKAVVEAGVAHCFTFVSTGGGASLDFLAKRTLPGIKALG